MTDALPLAVFGPSSLGSAVRLLAEPTGSELSTSARNAFSALYYAGWRGSAAVDRPFVALLPLDADYWGLVRAEVIARRELGDIFVAWLALIRPDQLDAIAWQSHRLWRTAFPERLWLPEAGTRLDPTLMLPEPLAPAHDGPAAEALAFALDRGFRRGERLHLRGEARLDEDPERAFALSAERLGALIARRSYATFDLEAHGLALPGGALDLLVGRAAPSAGRVLVEAGEAPDAAWLLLRERRTRISGEVTRLSPADAERLAAALLDEERGELLCGLPGPVFARLARELGPAAVALPHLLAATVEAQGGSPDRQAEAIDEFVRDALPAIPSDGAFAEPSAAVALLAYRRGLIFRLATPTIAALGRDLFGADGDEGITARVREMATALTVRDAAPSPVERDAIVAILDALAPGGERCLLAEQLTGFVEAELPALASDVRRHLAIARDYATARRRFHRMRMAARPGARGGFETRHAGALVAPLAATLAGRHGDADLCGPLADAFALLDGRVPPPLAEEAG